VKKLLPLIIYHFIFLAWMFLFQYFIGVNFEFGALQFFYDSTFYFFGVFISLLIFAIFFIYHNVPKVRTMLLLLSFMLKFLCIATYFLIMSLKYENLLKSNATATITIFIVNYLVFSIWMIFIYFRLNKKYIE